ncbi:MAG: branched-chain amino acid ABC transporter permease [Alphaproteobacteria bacterium]|nr:branched-chain amino acid ABC transporter permease [Alphaproteobacteria bacterium]
MSTPAAMAISAPTQKKTAAPLIVAAVVAAIGFALPSLGVPMTTLSLLAQASIVGVLATAVGFLVRQSGFVSFGHAAFYGGSAYLIALLAAHSKLSAEIILIAAPIIVLVAGFALAFIMLRTSGVAYSMLSLAAAQACFELMMKWRSIANGEDGLAIKLPREVFGLPLSIFQRPDSMFMVSWAVLVVIVVCLWFLSRSHFGTLTLAIKNNEERVRFLGYETLLPRAIIIALSAFIAAIGGVLFALYNGFVTPMALHWSLSGEALVIAIIGGTRAAWGPALGAFIFIFLRDIAGNNTTHWQGIVGITLIVVTVLLPNGISGALVTLWNRARGVSNV